MLTYSEMIKRDSFLARFRYLKLEGAVGIATFGFDRPLNQAFYQSYAWKSVRDTVIIRDDGCDLGAPGHLIMGKVLVHHMNPLRKEDIIERDLGRLFDPEYLICVSQATHNAIHFSDESQLPSPIIERKPGDTKLW